jgi:hypothetical protein
MKPSETLAVCLAGTAGTHTYTHTCTQRSVEHSTYNRHHISYAHTGIKFKHKQNGDRTVLARVHFTFHTHMISFTTQRTHL